MNPHFLTETHLDAIADGYVVILDNCLGKPTVDSAVAEANNLLAQSQFHAAGMGQKQQHHQNPQYRGDWIRWIDPHQVPPGFTPMVHLFENLRRYLNETAFLGLVDFEMQLAWYPGHGERYGKHRDTFVGTTTRVITSIYYLNPFWEPDFGGELVAFSPTGSPQVITPIADRLVIFRSDAVEHEVCPAYAPRWALTGWFRTQRGCEKIAMCSRPG